SSGRPSPTSCSAIPPPGSETVPRRYETIAPPSTTIRAVGSHGSTSPKWGVEPSDPPPTGGCVNSTPVKRGCRAIDAPTAGLALALLPSPQEEPATAEGAANNH